MRLGAKPPSRSFQHRRQCHPLSPGRCHSMPPSNLHAMLPVLSALPQRCSCGPCPLQGCRTPPASPPALQCALLPVWGLWGCSCTHLWALPGQSRTGPKHLHSAGGSQVIPVSGGRLSPLPAAGKGPLGLGCRHPHPPGKAPRPPGSGPAVPGAWRTRRRAGGDGGGPGLGPRLQGHPDGPRGERGQRGLRRSVPSSEGSARPGVFSREGSPQGPGDVPGTLPGQPSGGHAWGTAGVSGAHLPSPALLQKEACASPPGSRSSASPRSGPGSRRPSSPTR